MISCQMEFTNLDFPWNKGSHFPASASEIGGDQVLWGCNNLTQMIYKTWNHYTP